MNSIGAIAADALGGAASHLPWGWFSLLAIVDVLLVSVVIARRLQSRSRATGLRRPHMPPDGLVLRCGWWVPRSRVVALPSRHTTYAWPLHHEYMVRRVV